MSTVYRLILSALLATAATFGIQLVTENSSVDTINPIVFGIIFIACALSALISPAIKITAKTNKPRKNQENREQGKVKWFNVSKGYGFVTRPSGEEIFVHFRSIKGKGRRVLREGQSVEYSVADGDKGPQAEDVETVG